MKSTVVPQQRLNWSERIPHWFSWVVPLTIAAALLGVGRIHPPVQKSPAELMQSARGLIEKKDFEGALRETNELLAFFPTNHIYIHQAAGLAQQLKKHAEAATYLERLLLHSPNPGEACPDITRAYWSAGNTQKMLDSAERCIKLEPTNSDFKLELALATERSENLEAALEQYRLGLILFPDYGDFAIGHARILLRLGRADQAWREISVYIKSNPDVSDAELIAGLAAERTNQKARARAIFEEALRNHPDNLAIKDAYNNLLQREGDK